MPATLGITRTRRAPAAVAPPSRLCTLRQRRGARRPVPRGEGAEGGGPAATAGPTSRGRRRRASDAAPILRPMAQTQAGSRPENKKSGREAAEYLWPPRALHLEAPRSVGAAAATTRREPAA
ncbi:unnamed protein product [Prorocentrum cordatum]|uniref:Uncharacterized protein n=1 Tax=Prorocentrum cordatum TaxID=2364126 RepID=A0ABN9R8W3_9DINO|nr:unnamed protein product [Polarella glacialis]